MNYIRLRGIKKLYFGYEDISRILGITLESAKVEAARYVKHGILLRIKRNFYILRDKWDNLSREEMFAIANIAQVPSYISLMSALGYYDITTQIQRSFIESIAVKRTKEIQIASTTLNFTKIRKNLYFGFVKERDFFVATPEKALLDAIYLMSLKRYNFDLTSIDKTKLDMAKVKNMARKFPERTRRILKKYGYITKA